MGIDFFDNSKCSETLAASDNKIYRTENIDAIRFFSVFLRKELLPQKDLIKISEFLLRLKFMQSSNLEAEIEIGGLFDGFVNLEEISPDLDWLEVVADSWGVFYTAISAAPTVLEP